LANRDLQRGQAVGLASGEAVARRLEAPALTTEQLGLAEHGWTGETPLWLYILKEAEVLQAGEQLGPVGARVVGEVLVGIIDSDPESFRSVDPGWQPTLPGSRAGTFGLADILAPPSVRRAQPHSLPEADRCDEGQPTGGGTLLSATLPLSA
jgi:hypothetical protein